MNIPVPNTIVATILFSIAMCFGLALIAGLGRKAKRALVGTLKLYDDKNLLFFSIFWAFLMMGAFTISHLPVLIWMASAPLGIWALIKIIKSFTKRRKNHAT